jgi:type II secretory pathway pseudopilin PulG
MKRRAFTVVELLVVMGIIIGIVATLVVGLTAASRSARVANTEFMMNTMASALATFRNETGYLPPILSAPNQVITGAPTTAFGTIGWGRDLVFSPNIGSTPPPANHWANWSNIDQDTIQRYVSATSMAEYLLGLGDRSQDGYGVILDGTGALPPGGTPGSREQPTAGIRHPGADGVWGAVLNPRATMAGNGMFASRNLAVAAVAGNDTSSGFLKGKSLGPYMELKDRDSIGALIGFQADGTPLVAKPGEINNFDLAPKVILDYFGKPILYYRRGYVNHDPKTTNSNWSLADVFVLRPQRFAEGDAVNGLPDSNNDGSTSRQLLSAGFALMSFGPDQRWNPTARVDSTGYNADNIIRSGE